MCCLENQILELWKSWAFFETGVEIPDYDYDLPWVPYEDYMRAQLVSAVPGREGKLIVRFVPYGTEDKGLHKHPDSDRIIIVLEGSGEFVAKKEVAKERYAEIRISIQPGDRIWMPRGAVHNFIAGARGLLIESRHLPFIPFEAPNCLVRVYE